MMIKIKWKPTKQQRIAYRYLKDDKTTEVLYGGGAGGGKSYLGCAWLVINCLKYPGSRWLMGRAILKTLKGSTLLTFFRVCSEWGLRVNQDYKYNPIESTITFFNTNSQIYLKDLFHYPSDPEFDELGSTEFTGAFIDEASQVSEKAYQIVMSRIRYKLDEFKLRPKMLTCTNPTKNFLYKEFYIASRDKKTLYYRKFVKSLVTDNPYMPKDYIENLAKLDNQSKERLLFGNWEYDDDDTKLFNYESLISIFTNAYVEKHKDQKYITCDVARFGNDSTVIFVWQAFYIIRCYQAKKQSTADTVNLIKKIALEEGIPNHNITIDEDGVGGGVVDQLLGVRGFVNNSKPVEEGNKKLNYANLKSQCYHLLADKVNSNQIGCFKEINVHIKKLIVEDLEQIRRHNPDKDGKIQVTPKEEIKEHIGRSPDFGDAIMMRMIFELKRQYKPYLSALKPLVYTQGVNL